jgi:hypothetical protein
MGMGVGRRLASVDVSALPHDPHPYPSPTSLHSGARKRGPGGGGEIFRFDVFQFLSAYFAHQVSSLLNAA